MHQKLQERPFLILLFILISLGLTGTAALAQDTQPAPPRLHITNADTTSPPSIVLQAYGIDSDGSALALSASTVNIEHNGQPVTPEVAGTSPVGTLTVFLIDIPEGVADQIPAVQDAIQQFGTQVALYPFLFVLSPGVFFNRLAHLAIRLLYRFAYRFKKMGLAHMNRHPFKDLLYGRDKPILLIA